MSEQPTRSEPGKAWLYRPESIRLLWIVFAVILAGTVLAQFLVHMHPHFEAESWFGFNAIYGFVACVAMVLFAKLLGLALKRPDDYYGPDSDSETASGPAEKEPGA